MSAKLPISLAVVLPEVEEGRDACVRRLEELLEAKSGVSKVHRIIECEDGTPERLCVHFDRRRLSVADVCDYARRAGLELHQRYGHVTSRAPSMHARTPCACCGSKTTGAHE